jgi:hypothetical protein
MHGFILTLMRLEKYKHVVINLRKVADKLGCGQRFRVNKYPRQSVTLCTQGQGIADDAGKKTLKMLDGTSTC